MNDRIPGTTWNNPIWYRGWRMLNNGQSVELSAADRLPLDSPGKLCDAGFAGRDQIG